MKRLLVGDPHCRPDNLDKINKLFDIIESYGLPTIFLGDQLDTKDIVRAQCLNTYLKYFKRSQLQHILLVGNHDKLSNTSTEHALEAFKSLPNVIVVDYLYQQGNCVFLPYFSSTEDFKNRLSQVKLGYHDNYLFMHQGVTGCDYGNGFIAENELDVKELSAYKSVISGHFHRYQVKDNLTYLGTPFSHSFGESNQDKYLGIFDDETGSLELIKMQFPKHITLELDLGKPKAFKLEHDNYNRIILKGTREQIAAFDRSPLPGLKFIEECQQEVVKINLKETFTPSEMFSKWYKNIKNETDNELYTLGLTLLDEVK